MAKLRARGREEIFRVERTRPSSSPVVVIEAASRGDAEESRGDVLWVDGKSRGPTVDPRQTSLF